MAGRRGSAQWAGRPWIALAIRVAAVVAPFATSVVFAWQLSSRLPAVATVSGAIVRWVLIAIASTAVMIVADRCTRRLLPLAALFSLTLAFPDRAPSRFRLAIRTGTTLQLRKTIADAREGRIGTTPAESAEKLLELVSALSLHDRLTRGHCERVRGYAQVIGEELGLDDIELDRLRWAAMLHDIGELLVSADVLNKVGPLTTAEYEIVKQHPDFGRELVAPLAGWLGDASRAVWEHHERWDGSGYPRRLSGADVSLAARIVAVADAFDVMTSAQSYRPPVSAAAARAELARCAGSQFDPTVVRAFLNISLGRLRMVMGPLSWLTQLSFVPQSLASAGATGTSAVTAMTAVVGLGAGVLGIGLSDDTLPSTARAEAAPARSIRVDDPIGSPFVPPPPAPTDPTVAATPPTVAPETTPLVATTATVAPESTTPVTVPTDTKPPAEPAETKPAETKPIETIPVETAPPATGPPATEPAVTQPADTTLPPDTTSTVEETTTTSSTIATAPSTNLYLTSPGSGDLAWQDVLPLAPGAPADPTVANYDSDRNGDPGLTLLRGTDADHQHFRWDVGESVRLRGSLGVALHAVGKHRTGGFLVPGRGV
jgi:hypothetical protein